MTPNDQQSDAVNVLLMFILGLASGAAIALLYAPASGRDTRRYLGDRAQQARDQAAAAATKARDVVEQAKQAAVTTIDEWRPTVASAIDQSRQAIEQGKQTVAHAIEQGRDAYQQAKARNLA
jgi:gas vesicle protein